MLKRYYTATRFDRKFMVNKVIKEAGSEKAVCFIAEVSCNSDKNKRKEKRNESLIMYPATILLNNY